MVLAAFECLQKYVTRLRNIAFKELAIAEKRLTVSKLS